eukprot:COSAG04_NODE_14462_length_567_cov_0.696581_1_plen_76_part_10
MAVVEPLHSRYAALAKAPEIVPTTEIPKKIPDPHGFLTDPQDHLRGDTPCMRGAVRRQKPVRVALAALAMEEDWNR